MTSARALLATRSATLGAAAVAGLIDGLVATPAHRGLSAFVAVIAFGITAGAVMSHDQRLRAAAILALGTAAAVACLGPARTKSALGAAAVGLLIAAVAELSKWARLLSATIEICGHPIARGLASSGAIGLAGAVFGWAVVSGERTLSGLGLGALAFGVLAAVGLAVVVASAPVTASPRTASPRTASPVTASPRPHQSAPRSGGGDLDSPGRPGRSGTSDGRALS